jgi:hypothetical protein
VAHAAKEHMIVNAIELLKNQYEQGHSILRDIAANIPPELVNQRDGHGTAGSLGSICAHVVMSEDSLISLVRGEPTLYERDGWSERVGIAMPGLFQTVQWSSGVSMDMATFEPYMQAVIARTEESIGGMSVADLEKMVEGGMGRPVPASMLVGTVGVIHMAEHSGELAALLGVHGHKGLQF